MIDKKQFTATAMYSQGSYTSPAVKVVEIQAEGVLCISAYLPLATFEEWEDDGIIDW